MTSSERTSLMGTHVWVKTSAMGGTKEISQSAEGAGISL